MIRPSTGLTSPKWHPSSAYVMATFFTWGLKGVQRKWAVGFFFLITTHFLAWCCH